jgi:hypothetical protein
MAVPIRAGVIEDGLRWGLGTKKNIKIGLVISDNKCYITYVT